MTGGADGADRQRAVRSAIWFLLLWGIGPTLLRAAALAQFAGRFSSLTRAAAGCGGVLLVALPQDLFIALQVLAALVLLKALLTRLGIRCRPAAWAVLVTAGFAMVHCYLLFDCLLYCKTGIRMTPAFLDFLPTAACFWSSAEELGLGALAAGLGVMGVSLAGVFWLSRRIVPALSLSAWLAPMLLAGWWLAAASREALPPHAAYAAENLLLADESRVAAALFRPGPSLGAADQSAALRLLRPQAERWQPVSPEYPLLKRTKGFFGAKQFEIDVPPGQRPHVVLLFMESFRAADVGALGGRHGASPQFDRLAEEGVLFRNFYACSVQTTRAVIGSLFGILPCFSEKSAQESNLHVPLVGMADLLNRRGYASGYLTGTSLRFERQDEFFTSHGYAEVLGDRDLARFFPQARRTSWGFHDEYLMEYAVDWLRQKDRQGRPAFLTLFTISHHYPWQLPEGYRAPLYDTGGNAEYGRFLQTFHYSDHCLGLFMDRLREAGLDRRTIVFVLGDHGCSQGEHQDGIMLVNALYEENVHIPLLILARGRLARSAVIDELGSQVDLLPTVMDILGITGINHAVGTSLVRRVKDRAVYFNNPFALQFLGLRRGNMKYIYTVRSRTPSLFDLEADPRERRDLAAQCPAEVERDHRAISTINRLFLDLYLGGRIVGPRAD